MNDQQPKIEKPAKVPGKFRKPIKEKVFQKRYLKLLEQRDDREWFESQFELQEGKYCIRAGVDKNGAKRLKKLYGVIQKNRKGSIRMAPLVLTGIVIGGIVLFFAVFANPLLTFALEKGLEAAFEAKADVNRLRLSAIKFEIAIESITVANRDKPMTNLFEMGKTRIKLKPEAVLMGKVYIEEIRADSLRFGTPRTVSGAIPRRPPKPPKEKPPKSDSPPFIDLQNFDAMALLNQEFEKLNTPKLYDNAINAYNETAEKWKGQVDSAMGKADELKATAQPLLGFNVNSINVNVRDPASIQATVSEIQTMVNDVNAMVSTVQTAADEAAGMVKGIEADINMARSLEQNARNAITGDVNYLKSLIDLDGGAAFAILEPIIRDMLSDTAEMYLDYGLMALEVFEKLRAEAAAKPKTEKPVKEPKVVFKGRDVVFPTKAYPAFYLGRLESDFTIQDWNWDFNLENISSNPDYVNHRPLVSNTNKQPVNPNNPILFTLGVTEETGLQRQIAFNGNADFKTAAADRFNARVDGSGFPLSLGDALSSIGIGGLYGETAFDVNFIGKTDGGISGGGSMKILEATLANPQGTVAEALDIAVREAGNVNLGVQYTHHPDARDEFKITSNIAELMAQALKRLAGVYAEKAMDEIERALRERISQYIDGKFVAQEDLDNLLKLARGDLAALDDLKGTLNNKRSELEGKARGVTDQAKAIAEQAAQQAKDELARQGQQAAQDLMQGQTPSLQAPTPNIPTPSAPPTPSVPRIPGR
ncbi:MAG: hypothetical protein FWD36_01550 [Treponema sp.]|nr:hypothetical protein [Treponema sp.]